MQSVADLAGKHDATTREVGLVNCAPLDERVGSYLVVVGAADEVARGFARPLRRKPQAGRVREFDNLVRMHRNGGHHPLG